MGDIRSGEEQAAFKVDYTINPDIKALPVKADGTKDEVKEGTDYTIAKGENGKYTFILTDSEGKEHKVEADDMPATIEDKDGNTYEINEKGEVKPVSKNSPARADVSSVCCVAKRDLPFGQHTDWKSARARAYAQLQRLLDNKDILSKADNIEFEKAISASEFGVGNSVSDVHILLGGRKIEIETKAGMEFFENLGSSSNFMTQSGNSLMNVSKIEDYKVFLNPGLVVDKQATINKVVDAWSKQGWFGNRVIMDRALDILPADKTKSFVEVVSNGNRGLVNNSSVGAYDRRHSWYTLKKIQENEIFFKNADEITFEMELEVIDGIQQAVPDIVITKDRIKYIGEIFSGQTGVKSNLSTQTIRYMNAVESLENLRFFCHKSQDKAAIIEAWKKGGVLDDDGVYNLFKKYDSNIVDKRLLEKYLIDNDEWFEMIFNSNFK
ncbi:hypothetical protein FACS1894169_04700 [Bacteroidia bacterium]|nr:hypothetical protein FACS1894169_04700 [Bacteroidia bacterium]